MYLSASTLILIGLAFWIHFWLKDDAASQARKRLHDREQARLEAWWDARERAEEADWQAQQRFMAFRCKRTAQATARMLANLKAASAGESVPAPPAPAAQAAPPRRFPARVPPAAV